MSSDETETEAQGFALKTLCRVPKIWLDPKIASMWAAVETKGRVYPPRQGNNHLLRNFTMSSSTPMQCNPRQVVKGLPHNFYSPLWYRGLTDAQRHLIDASEISKPIPSQARYLLGSIFI